MKKLYALVLTVAICSLIFVPLRSGYSASICSYEPVVTVGSLTVDRLTIDNNHSAIITVSLAASSTVASTAGTTLSLNIADPSGTFTLDTNPTSQEVNLSGASSATFRFTVSRKSGSGSCAFSAHVAPGSGVTVIENDVHKTRNVTISG